MSIQPKISDRNESEQAEQYPWRNPNTLRELYCERGLSLREIGNKLDCDPKTVHKWAGRFGIELRTPNNQKIHPAITTDSKGYTIISSQHDGKRYQIRLHQLVASRDEEPEKVFDDEKQVHHNLRIPSSFGVEQIDIPGNLEVMDTHEHLSKHNKGTHEVSDIVDLLDNNTDS